MRLHVLCPPYSELTKDWSQCGFTSRALTFCNMMSRAGYDVTAYGGETHELESAEHVELATRKTQQMWWPDFDPKRHVWNDYDANSQGWRKWNERAVKAIRERSEPGDVLCITQGFPQKGISDALPQLFSVETTIGYEGVFAPYRVFATWAWRHYLAGKFGPDDVRFYDDVIPHAYDTDDFPLGEGDGGYALYIGRLTARKGPHIAAEACKRAGVPLHVVGPGVGTVEPGRITATDGTVLEGDVTYLGFLDAKERAEVMGKASCVLVPTMYLEPFGGVCIEAQLTGTPAIVSDWGGLTENVIQGETGFRCRMLHEFSDAIELAPALHRRTIRAKACEQWGTGPIGERFDAYFSRLSTLAGEGWYAEPLVAV